LTEDKAIAQVDAARQHPPPQTKTPPISAALGIELYQRLKPLVLLRSVGPLIFHPNCQYNFPSMGCAYWSPYHELDVAEEWASTLKAAKASY